jgi:hypothetical protein
VEPATLDAAAAGRFKARAKPRASVVDADRLRLAAVALLMGAGAVLGLAAGVAL